MQKFFKQKNKAFTLIETLVAISIFTMSILGLMSVLASGISNTNYAKQKMTATYLAQEGIEYARNKRDNHFLDGSGWSGFRSDSSVTTFPTSGDYTNFTRKITMTPIGDGTNEAKITSTVVCTQCSSPYSITLSENLFNWVE